MASRLRSWSPEVMRRCIIAGAAQRRALRPEGMVDSAQRLLRFGSSMSLSTSALLGPHDRKASEAVGRATTIATGCGRTVTNGSSRAAPQPFGPRDLNGHTGRGPDLGPIANAALPRSLVISIGEAGLALTQETSNARGRPFTSDR